MESLLGYPDPRQNPLDGVSSMSKSTLMTFREIDEMIARDRRILKQIGERIDEMTAQLTYGFK